jgi:sugar phosphate isomerase/epimerase
LSKTTRRRFLGQCSAAVGAALLLPADSLGSGYIQPSVRFPTEPRQRIAVASYPFREFVAGRDHKSGNPSLELKDFAAHVVEKFGVRHIEPWSAHFPTTDPKYLAELRAAITKAGSSVVNIAADGEHSPYAAEAGERQKAIAFSKNWIDVAVALGSPSVRTNIPVAKDAQPDIGRLAFSLREVAMYASVRNVVVHFENDNPVSEDPFFLAQVLDKARSPWLHTLPDFCNTLAAHDEDYAYRAIDTMFGHAYGICHIKDSETNAQGKLVHVDLAKTFAILKAHRYKGYCSIEYDAPGDVYKATAELVEQTAKFLA